MKPEKTETERIRRILVPDRFKIGLTLFLFGAVSINLFLALTGVTGVSSAGFPLTYWKSVSVSIGGVSGFSYSFKPVYAAIDLFLLYLVSALLDRFYRRWRN